MLPADAAILLTLILASPLLALLCLGSAGLRALARRWGRLPPDQVSWMERRWVVRASAGYLAVYALCFAYGSLVEAHWVLVRPLELRVKEPVLGHARFRIVHLTDLHLEEIGRRERRMFELVREAKPDLILLTGDYVNAREGLQALQGVLESLRALAPRYGIYGVEGNWDHKFPVRAAFERAGARLLSDETESLREGAHALRLVGHSVFPSRTLKDLLRGLDGGAYTIYLHHMPDAVDELAAREPGQRVDLFLCGHTHGGQVRLPFWGAVLTLSKYHKKYEQGFYQVGDVSMYVNRGLGMEGGAAPRVRFLAPPEVAVIDLVAK